MFVTVVLIALSGCFGVSATYTETDRIMARQSSQTQTAIPLVCNSQCTTIVDEWNDCLTDSVEASCVDVCKSFQSAVVPCFQCIIDNTAGLTKAGFADIEDEVNDFAEGCTASGYPVANVTFTEPKKSGDAAVIVARGLAGVLVAGVGAMAVVVLVL